MTKAFIISYNRLTYLQNLCTELVKRDCEPIIVDNGSTYEPLLEWLNTGPYNVHELPRTYGHKSAWFCGVIDAYKGEDYYIVTDHDLDISGVPLDMVEVLKEGLKHNTVPKVGLSLRIDDLPENDYTKEVVKWESKFWKTQVAGNFYLSDIDTTLALYNAKFKFNIHDDSFFRAYRAPEPYTARHLPWYNEGNLSEEERYYFDHLTHTSYWSQKYKELYK